MKLKIVLVALLVACARRVGAWETTAKSLSSYYVYNEPTLCTIQGVMSGVSVKIEQTTQYYFAGELSFEYGNVRYQSVKTGTIPSQTNVIAEARGLFGVVRNQTVWFSGLGFRYLNADNRGLTTSTSAFGYERQSRLLYLPVGVFTQSSWRGWTLRPSTEVDFLLWGQQQSSWTHVILRNRQTVGGGVRVEVEFRKTTKQITFVVAPFFNGWVIMQSNTIHTTATRAGVWCEPTNLTAQAGLKLGLSF